MPVLRDLEQLRYWQGQLLRSRDFRDQGAIEAERRWWHNRAVHAEFGVRYGLKTTGAASAGVLNISVDCGLAYDCFGRELILGSTQIAPLLPPGPASLVLVLAYNVTPDGGTRLFWKPETELRIGDGVAVGRVTFSGTVASLDTGFRPAYARAMSRPRLASGDTVHGNTPWEAWIETLPNANGSPTETTVGVQTRVDTSAAGFTATPNYFATLQWPQLKLADESFASAYFPSIAEASDHGFIYRLLMKGIARRRLQVAFGVSEAVTSQFADPKLAKVVSASAFRAGDNVARVVPRSQTVSHIDNAAGPVLNLHAPLTPLLKDDVLAIGNLPRTAKVTSVKGSETAMTVTLSAAAAVQPGDLMVKIGAVMGSDAFALVTDVKGATVTLDTPIVGLASPDQVGFARPSQSFGIASVAVDAGVMTVILDDPSVFSPGEVAVRTTAGADAAAAVVLKSLGNVLTLKTPIDGLGADDVLSRVPQTFTVGAVGSKKQAMQCNVDEPWRFREGDFVARYDAGLATSLPVQIESISNKTIFLSATLAGLAKGDTLGAANLGPTYGVSAVLQLDTIMTVTVATPEGFAAGDAVAKHNGTDGPVLVDDIKGNVLTLRNPILGLQAGDLLVTARFPRSATVTPLFKVNNYSVLSVDVPGALRFGDLVMRIDDLVSLTTPASLPMVVYTAASLVVLLGAMPINAGDQLMPVAFRSRAIVVTPPSVATPHEITIDRTLDLREGDLAGPLVAYGETSRPQSIASIAANTLTLSAPIDGLIEGDLVGPASLSQDLGRLRFENAENLQRGDDLQVAGLDSMFLQPSSGAMQIVDLDLAKGVVTLLPSGPLAGVRLRPETLSVAALFNANFVSSFVSFAQKQNLYVCWLGCQTETQNPAQCPGDAPSPDPCGSGD